MLPRCPVIRSSHAGRFRLETPNGFSLVALLSAAGLATAAGAQPAPKTPVQTAGYVRYALPGGGVLDPVCTRTSSALDAFVQHNCPLVVARRANLARPQGAQPAALSIDGGGTSSQFAGDGSSSEWSAGRESQHGAGGSGVPGFGGAAPSGEEFSGYQEAPVNASSAVQVSAAVTVPGPRARQAEPTSSGTDSTGEAGVASASFAAPRYNMLQADTPDLATDFAAPASSRASGLAQDVRAPATSINQGIDFDQPTGVTSVVNAPAPFGAPGFSGTEELMGAQLFDAPTVGALLDLPFEAAPAAVVLPAAVEIVPEPASLALVGTGLAMLVAFRARRKAEQL